MRRIFIIQEGTFNGESRQKHMGAFKLSIWELSIPPLWWWLLVLGMNILFIYLLKGILKDEEECIPPSAEDRFRSKIIQLKLLEITAWIFMPIGFIIYIYGILNPSSFIVFFIGSGLVIVGYLVATHCRKQRLAYQKERTRES